MQPTSRKNRQRPRLVDVARLAGTSEATASVVINNRLGGAVRVSEETQQRIWNAVRTLGYTANPVARNLAGGQNKILGVFTFEATFPIEFRDFYYPFLVGIEEEAAAQGYDLLLFASASDASGRRTIYRDGINRLQLADGAILLGLTDDRSEINSLLRDGFPFVFAGRRESPLGEISYAAADYAQGTQQIVNYLVKFGHQTICYLGQPSVNESSADREAGFHRGFEQSGLPVAGKHIWRGHVDALTAESLAGQIAQGVTAFISELDVYGLRVLELAATLGLSCPGDFSLAVLGDPLTPTVVVPDWTSFKTPRFEMGRDSVRLLVRLLTDPPDTQVRPYRSVLPCTFVPGTTVAPPKQHQMRALAD